jgi:tRNA (guanosine-2'-O-)-methyltransferase
MTNSSDIKKKLLSEHPEQYIIDTLQPYLTDARRERIDAVIECRLNSIQLAIECPSDINNALAAIRTCEALGISHIHIIKQESSAVAIKNITQGAFYWVNVHFYKTMDDFLIFANNEKLQLAGGTVTSEQTLNDIPVETPLCILIGNEQRGLSQQAQQACQYPYKIPMHGMSESMNLSVSAAISLYDVSCRKRQRLGRNGDLSQQQQAHLRAQYYLHSTETRLAHALLKKHP